MEERDVDVEADSTAQEVEEAEEEQEAGAEAAAATDASLGRTPEGANGAVVAGSNTSREEEAQDPSRQGGWTEATIGRKGSVTSGSRMEAARSETSAASCTRMATNRGRLSASEDEGTAVCGVRANTP